MIRENKVRILLVDDRQPVLEGLRRILELDAEIEVVSEAKNCHEAIYKAIQLSSDTIVVDLKLPEMDGINAIRELKQGLHKVNVLMLTVGAVEFIEQAIEAEASDYLLKDNSSKQITNTAHQVYDGLCSIPPAVTRQPVVEYAQPVSKYRSTYDPLSSQPLATWSFLQSKSQEEVSMKSTFTVPPCLIPMGNIWENQTRNSFEYKKEKHG